MTPRHADFLDSFQRGETIASIADRHGVSRQAVQQLLAHYGLTRHDGGIALQRVKADPVRAAALRKANEAGHDKRCRATLGISYETFTRYRSEVENYRQTREWARERGIGWRITFPEFLQAWWDTGSGNPLGDHHMVRKNFDGDYVLGNIEFVSMDGRMVRARAKQLAAA